MYASGMDKRLIDEDWKYLDLKAVSATPFGPAPKATVDISAHLLPEMVGTRQVFVNGRHAPHASCVAALPAGAATGWPNGYSSFYIGRYEITQGQYADFLNTAPSGAAAGSCAARGSSGATAGGRRPSPRWRSPSCCAGCSACSGPSRCRRAAR